MDQVEAGWEPGRRELLVLAECHAEMTRRSAVDLLCLAGEWALANGAESIDPDLAGLPGRPGLRFYGGPGTPYVASTAGAELGARIGKSSFAGDAMVADALDLEFRLPRLRRRVEAGEVDPSYARFVARRTRGLEIEAADYVDERVAESADGRIPWSRFEALVEAAIVAADLPAAEAREKAAREQRFARTTRSTEDGMRGLYLRTDAASVALLDATIAYVADALKALGSTDDLDTRRAMAMIVLASPADAVTLLAQYSAWRDRPADPPEPSPEPSPDPEPVPGESSAAVVADARALFERFWPDPTLGERPVIDWSRLLPQFTIFAHWYAGTAPSSPERREAPGLVRLEGLGPVTEAWLTAHLDLHPQTRVRVTPVIDLEGQAPVDAWEIPDRHRRAVRLMTPADVFPWGSASTNQPGGWRSMQIDHTVPWQSGGRGQSGIGNYGPLTQAHHNLKTHASWEVRQPFPGIFVWRDPEGATYLVDHTGTRRVDGHPQASEPSG